MHGDHAWPVCRPALSGCGRISALSTARSSASLPLSRAVPARLQVESEFKVQGLELRPLPLIPQQLEKDPPAAATTTAARFDACMARDVSECPRGEVQTKALCRALAAAALPGAELVLLSCGDEQRPIVHIMCSFVGQDGTVDGYSLNLWLPTRDPGDD